MRGSLVRKYILIGLALVLSFLLLISTGRLDIMRENPQRDNKRFALRRDERRLDFERMRREKIGDSVPTNKLFPDKSIIDRGDVSDEFGHQLNPDMISDLSSERFPNGAANVASVQKSRDDVATDPDEKNAERNIEIEIPNDVIVADSENKIIELVTQNNIPVSDTVLVHTNVEQSDVKVEPQSEIVPIAAASAPIVADSILSPPHAVEESTTGSSLLDNGNLQVDISSRNIVTLKPIEMKEARKIYSDPIIFSITRDTQLLLDRQFPYLSTFQEYRYSDTCIEAPVDNLRISRTEAVRRFKTALQTGDFCDRTKISNDLKPVFESIHGFTLISKPKFFIELSSHLPQYSISNMMSYAFPTLTILYYGSSLQNIDDTSNDKPKSSCIETLRGNVIEMSVNPYQPRGSVFTGKFDCFQFIDSLEKFSGDMFPFEFEEYLSRAICRCNATWIPLKMPDDAFFTMWSNSTDLIVSAMTSSSTACSYRIELNTDSPLSKGTTPTASASATYVKKSYGSSASSTSSSSSTKYRQKSTHFIVYREESGMTVDKTSGLSSSVLKASSLSHHISKEKRAQSNNYQPSSSFAKSDYLFSGEPNKLDVLTVQRIMSLGLKPSAMVSVLSSFAASQEDMLNFDMDPSSLLGLVLRGDGYIQLDYLSDPSDSTSDQLTSSDSINSGYNAFTDGIVHSRGSSSLDSRVKRRLGDVENPSNWHVNIGSGASAGSNSSSTTSLSVGSTPSMAPTTPVLAKNELASPVSISASETNSLVSSAEQIAGEIYSLFSHASQDLSFRGSSGRSGRGFFSKTGSIASYSGFQNSDSEWVLPMADSLIPHSSFVNSSLFQVASTESEYTTPVSESNGISLNALGRASLRALKERERNQLRNWLSIIIASENDKLAGKVKALNKRNLKSGKSDDKASDLSRLIRRSKISSAETVLIFGRYISLLSVKLAQSLKQGVVISVHSDMVSLNSHNDLVTMFSLDDRNIVCHNQVLIGI